MRLFDELKALMAPDGHPPLETPTRTKKPRHRDRGSLPRIRSPEPRETADQQGPSPATLTPAEATVHEVL